MNAGSISDEDPHDVNSNNNTEAGESTAEIAAVEAVTEPLKEDGGEMEASENVTLSSNSDDDDADDDQVENDQNDDADDDQVDNDQNDDANNDQVDNDQNDDANDDQVGDDQNDENTKDVVLQENLCGDASTSSEIIVAAAFPVETSGSRDEMNDDEVTNSIVNEVTNSIVENDGSIYNQPIASPSSDDESSVDSGCSSELESDVVCDFSDDNSQNNNESCASSIKHFYSALESIYNTTNLRNRATQARPMKCEGNMRDSAVSYLNDRTQDLDDSNDNNMEQNRTEPLPFQIKIKGEMLGLTVENVLESTYIRTIVRNGMAAAAGAKVGCIIAQIGENKTRNLTHFETIEMLRSSHRPLLLTLQPKQLGHVSQIRDCMAELNAGWKFSPAASLFGTKVDLTARFMSIMSVFLAKVEAEGEEADEIQIIQQILFDHVSRHLIGSSVSFAQAKPVPSKSEKGLNNAAKAVKINKIPTKKLLKKQIRQTLHKLSSNNQPVKQTPKKHNFTQVLTQLNPYWGKFEYLSRDIILLLLDSCEENAKILFQLMAHDLNIPLSDEILQSENNAMTIEDKMPVVITQVDTVREVSVSAYLPLVHATSQASLSKRKSCAVICRLLWSREGHLEDLPEMRLQIRGVLTRLLHDVDSVVRRTTVQTLLYIISTLDHSHLCSSDIDHEKASLDPTLGWLVTLSQRLLTDPVPDLRSKSILLVTNVAGMLPKGATNIESYLLQCKLLPISSRAAEDKSPVVRQSLALHLPRLIDALSPHWVGVLLDVIIALLGDDDHIVKVGVLCSLCDLEPSLLDTILPLIKKLVNDNYAGVRCALARTAGKLLVHCHQGNNEDLQRHLDATLLPLLQKLLNDSDAQVTSAALQAIADATQEFPFHQSNEATTKPILSEKHVLKLIPTLRHLVTNPIWRVRSSAVEIIPTLLQCTKKLDVRVEIAQLCIGLLGDKVDCVRSAAAEALCGGKLVGSPILESSQYELADFEWVDMVLLPHMKACAQSEDYRQRLLCFKMTRNLLKYSNNSNEDGDISSKPRQAALEVLHLLADDKVPNIRLNVGKVFFLCYDKLSRNELAASICILQDLKEKEEGKSNGGDRDVLFYTKEALSKAAQIKFPDIEITLNEEKKATDGSPALDKTTLMNSGSSHDLTSVALDRTSSKE